MIKPKIIYLYLTIAILFTVISVKTCWCSEVESILVVKQNISQYNSVFQGFIDYLKESGKIPRIIQLNIDDRSELARIQSRLQEFNFIIAIGSDATKISVEKFGNIPMILSMILNPEKEITAENLADKRIIACVSAYASPNFYFENLKKLGLSDGKIGFIYTREIYNGYINEIKSRATANNIRLEYEQISTKESFIRNFNRLIDKKITGYLILPDFNIYNNDSIKYLLMTALRSKVYCIGPSSAFVKSGALWGADISPYGIGRETGAILKKYINNEQLPNKIFYTESAEITVNLVVAEKLEIEIPTDIIQKANVSVK